MSFIDEEGEIIIPRSIRPIIEYRETLLGSSRGAKKQYRYGSLHIREYDGFYKVHMDRIDPVKNPIGHLLVDAPEYLAGGALGLFVGKKVASSIYNKKIQQGRTASCALYDGLVAGTITGSIVAVFSFLLGSIFKKNRRK